MNAAIIAVTVLQRLDIGSAGNGSSALDYLEQSGKFVWDFTSVAQTKRLESLFTSVTDISSGGVNLVNNTNNYPRYDRIQTGYDIKSCVRTLANTNYGNVMLSSSAPNVAFSSSFNLLVSVAFEDFQISNQAIMGVQDAAFNNGVQLLNNNGVISFKYAAGGNSFTIATDAAILNDGLVGETLFDIQVDFENNTVAMYIGGVSYASTITGTVASVDPSTFNVSTLKLAVGGHNVNGTIATNNTAKIYFTKIFCTPLMTASVYVQVIDLITSTTTLEAVTTVDENYALIPTDYNSNLVYWADADDVNYFTFKESGKISKLFDKAGVDAYSVQSGSENEPDRITSGGQKGRAYVQFISATGGNGGLLGTRLQRIQNKSGLTVFIVSDKDVRVSGGFDNNSNTQFMWFLGDSNYYGVISNGSAANGLVNQAANAVNLGVWTFDGTLSGNANRLKFQLNNVDKTLTFTGTIPATTENNSSSSFALGAIAYLPTIKSTGKLYEVVIINRALTTQEKTDLYNYYLKPKFGLS